MTFEEARKLLQEQSDQGADTWYGPDMENHTRVKGHLEWGAVELILFQLQKHYEKGDTPEADR